MLELAAGTQRDRTLDRTGDELSKSLPSAISSSSSHEAPAKAAAPTPSQVATQVPRVPSKRILAEQPSEEVSEQAAAEAIAGRLKQAFDTGNLHNEDALVNTSATFWLKKYQAGWSIRLSMNRSLLALLLAICALGAPRVAGTIMAPETP